MRGHITSQQIETAYLVSAKIFDKALSVESGVNSLIAENLNPNSARDFINNYRAFRHGKLYQRTLSQKATDYFLKRISMDNGIDDLRLAIQAVTQHINYYENLTSTNLPSLRRIVERYTAELIPMNVHEYLDSFERDVFSSYADDSAARGARLKNAASQPKRRAMTVDVFIRNPDVVAEVLHRANGNCESCKQPAPFHRKSNGKAYLEVHHRIRLADGGHDCVDNAVAVCPNCHRKAHYG